VPEAFQRTPGAKKTKAFVCGGDFQAEAPRFPPVVGNRHVGGLPWRLLARALRPHHWLKNILLLVPALAAHQFGAPLAASVVAFFSFSLCASSAYILNDFLDLENDRAHPRKKLRPFASRELSLTSGALLSLALLAASMVVALSLPPTFLLVLLGYYAFSGAYSAWLKRMLLIDVAALVCLYGVRLVAGGAASSIPLSPWLAAFSMFLFFCLATIKRCAELADQKKCGGIQLAGRNYSTADLPALISMSAASALVSVLVLALYMESDIVRAAYSHPDRLWYALIPFMFWIGRMLLLTHRGEMHDDPLVFAARDRIGIAAALSSLLIVALSA
jgi:4-hydroxybenzoate polyprenyltransferase